MYRVEILFDDKLTHFFLIIVGFIGLFLFGLGFWYGCLFGSLSRMHFYRHLGMVSSVCYENSGEHPLDESCLLGCEVSHGQFHHNMVPSFAEMYCGGCP